MTSKIIQQGAEAIILKEKDKIIKRRTKKLYRILEIDEKIRKRRTRLESRLIKKASLLIPIPEIEKTDEKNMEIRMEFIDGKKLSEKMESFSEEEQKKICIQIGESIAKLHDKNIIHGDLTTSNTIFKDDKVYFIDFGLGFNSHRIEDKAVDLHLIKQALEAKHFQNWKALFNSVIKGYEHYKNYEKVIEQLKRVEKRGRYKH